MGQMANQAWVPTVRDRFIAFGSRGNLFWTTVSGLDDVTFWILCLDWRLNVKWLYSTIIVLCGFFFKNLRFLGCSVKCKWKNGMLLYVFGQNFPFSHWFYRFLVSRRSFLNCLHLVFLFVGCNEIWNQLSWVELSSLSFRQFVN